MNFYILPDELLRLEKNQHLYNKKDIDNGKQRKPEN